MTLLLPAPDAPPVIVIQLALLTAVHDTVDETAVTLTLPVPADGVNVADGALSENCGAAAACVTASEAPAIAMAPDRVLVAEFAATE